MRAIFAHDLTNRACRRKAGKTAEIDPGFSVSAPLQDAACAGDNRKNVPGTGQILGPAPRVRKAPERCRAIRRRNPRRGSMDPVNALSEGSAVKGSPPAVRLNAELETSSDLRIDCAADQSPGFAGHEIDITLGYAGRCNHQVSLGFAICVICHDDHASAAKPLDCPLNRLSTSCTLVASKPLSQTKCSSIPPAPERLRSNGAALAENRIHRNPHVRSKDVQLYVHEVSLSLEGKRCCQPGVWND